MPGTPFSVARLEHDGDTVLTLVGDINRAAEEGLRGGYEDARGTPGRLILDFSATDYVNSTGIALIVGLLADARATGREVLAVGLSEHYREIFAITRLSDFMTIYPDLATAQAN